MIDKCRFKPKINLFFLTLFVYTPFKASATAAGYIVSVLRWEWHVSPIVCYLRTYVHCTYKLFVAVFVITILYHHILNAITVLIQHVLQFV